MQNALVNLDIESNYKKALTDLGYDLEHLYEYEHDAALGNGGLGRLAACFLDSMATLNLPCWGYGIRYTYGIFEQKIVNGWQVEHPDYWLIQDNPWEIERADITYAVRFYGTVQDMNDPKTGKACKKWTGGEIVQAVAYDNAVPGFDTHNTLNLRLWRATPPKEFDFHAFNAGKYLESVRDRQRAEYISAVLYPNDNTEEGKELRLKQQYFFVCATLQDVLRRFKRRGKRDWQDLPSKVCMQLNDTHPTIGIPELMRILVDIEGLDWEFAWGLTKQVFNYTNHTVLPEALEKWPASLIEKLLPRHLLIINDINFHFLNEVRSSWGDEWEKIGKMSIYEDGYTKLIRMANLAVIGSNKVNGVAAIHSDIVRTQLFKEFREYYEQRGIPDKFVNVTNGVTPRRWIHCANSALSNLMSEWLGSDSWLKELDMTQGLLNHVDDPKLIKEWADVKKLNKQRLARWVQHNCAVSIDANRMLFDIQVKRIHEYKRQFMNCLYIIHRYLWLKDLSPQDREKVVPRAIMLGGKAAPGYTTAKTIIRMVGAISQVVNEDKDVNQYLKVVFLPNYNVSNAQIIIPASDISQHISTAGTEASGTSNMKFVMNGGLIIGTMDGANVEICDECRPETMFVFGCEESEVSKVREKAKSGHYPIDPKLQRVFDWVKAGNLQLGDKEAQHQFVQIIEQVTNNGLGSNGDFYLVCHDFPSYCDAQNRIDEMYKKPDDWTKLTIKAASLMGKFSTDRTMREYSCNIWNIKPHERPPPVNPQKTEYGNDQSDMSPPAAVVAQAREADAKAKQAADKKPATGAATSKSGGR
eukprot:GHVN01053773.1.p1 GENE.GHVN01053773.1~~GHVN01053773.1.p1  ORF type:complete len:810 (-),score=109.39 GHVN01053773.1:171-2600(-)